MAQHPDPQSGINGCRENLPDVQNLWHFATSTYTALHITCTLSFGAANCICDSLAAHQNGKLLTPHNGSRYSAMGKTTRCLSNKHCRLYSKVRQVEIQFVPFQAPLEITFYST